MAYKLIGSEGSWKTNGKLDGRTFKLSIEEIKWEASFFPHLPQPIAFLGQGARGCVFTTTDPGIVLKTSSDESEESLFIAQREYPEILNYTAKIHYLIKLGSNAMFIWRERVSIDNRDESHRFVLKEKFWQSIRDTDYHFYDTHNLNWGYRISTGQPVFFDV